MSELAKKNIECLAAKMKDIEEDIQNYIDKNGASQKTVYIDRSAREELILAKEKDGRIWYLNSRYDAQHAAKVLADAQGEIHYRNIFLLCGLGNGMYLQELLKRLGSDNIVIVYEPDPEVFVRLIENVDMTGSFGDKRVLVFAEEINTNTFSQYFGIVFRYELIDLSKFIIPPDYGMLYSRQIQEFHDSCWRGANIIQGEKNTLADIGYEMADNVIANLWNMTKKSTINKLEEYIKDADFVITGEGCLDGQSVMGKAPIGVAGLAKKHHKKVIAFAGCVTEDAKVCNQNGIDAFFPILRNVVTREEAMQAENARRNMTDTAEQVFRLIKAMEK